MLKFLRKYKQLILGMFIVILMVAFVAPQLIQELGPNPLKTKVATIDGSPITAEDVMRASAEIRALEMVSPIIPGMIQIDPQGNASHWMLLKHEARKAGFIGEANDGRDWLPEIASQMVQLSLQRQYQQLASFYMNTPEAQQQIIELNTRLQENIPQAAGNARISTEDVFKALAAARGIARMQEAFILAARPSVAQSIRAVRDQQDRATVNALYIPAASFNAGIPDPTDEEVAAHIARYADIAPGTGEFGLGYRLPPRVKLEWMVIDRATVAASIPIDRVEIRKRYDTDRTRYAGEFEAERDRIRQDYIDAMTQEIMGEINRLVRAEVLKVTRRLESDGPYKRLPDNWSEIRPSYESIAQAVVDGLRQSKRVEIPVPAVERRDAAWLTDRELFELPGIGRATIRIGNIEELLARAAFQVRELGGAPAYGLQVGMPEIETPATDISGNVYFFTIFDAVAAAPASGPEDAPTAREDLKSLKAYEMLVEQMPVYEQMASLQTLDAVAGLIGAGNGPIVSPLFGITMNRSRVISMEPALDAETFRDAVMDAAAKIDPRGTPTEIENSEHAVVAVAIPENRGIVIAKITGVQPTTLEDFRSFGSGIVQAAVFREIASVDQQGEAVNPFTLELLIKRNNYKSLEGETASADDA